MAVDPAPRRRRRWAFYPAPWLLAAPVVAVAAALGSVPLAVAAAAYAVYLMRCVFRPSGHADGR